MTSKNRTEEILCTIAVTKQLNILETNSNETYKYTHHRYIETY